MMTLEQQAFFYRLQSLQSAARIVERVEIRPDAHTIAELDDLYAAACHLSGAAAELAIRISSENERIQCKGVIGHD